MVGQESADCGFPAFMQVEIILLVYAGRNHTSILGSDCTKYGSYVVLFPTNGLNGRFKVIFHIERVTCPIHSAVSLKTNQ